MIIIKITGGEEEQRTIEAHIIAKQLEIYCRKYKCFVTTREIHFVSELSGAGYTHKIIIGRE